MRGRASPPSPPPHPAPRDLQPHVSAHLIFAAAAPLFLWRCQIRDHLRLSYRGGRGRHPSPAAGSEFPRNHPLPIRKPSQLVPTGSGQAGLDCALRIPFRHVVRCRDSGAQGLPSLDMAPSGRQQDRWGHPPFTQRSAGKMMTAMDSGPVPRHGAALLRPHPLKTLQKAAGMWHSRPRLCEFLIFFRRRLEGAFKRLRLTRPRRTLIADA